MNYCVCTAKGVYPSTVSATCYHSSTQPWRLGRSQHPVCVTLVVPFLGMICICCAPNTDEGDVLGNGNIIYAENIKKFSFFHITF